MRDAGPVNRDNNRQNFSMNLSEQNTQRGFYHNACPEFMERVAAARKTVARLDGQEGRCCRLPQSILSALVCGLQHPETNAQYEALVMLETLVLEELNSYHVGSIN